MKKTFERDHARRETQKESFSYLQSAFFQNPVCLPCGGYMNDERVRLGNSLFKSPSLERNMLFHIKKMDFM